LPLEPIEKASIDELRSLQLIDAGFFNRL